MPFYRKKPVVIEAFQWTGDHTQSEEPKWIVSAIHSGKVYLVNNITEGIKLMIHTLEGEMTANKGDYIIKGIKGEIYPCKPDIFVESYEKVLG